MKDYKELKVWQKAMDLVIELYKTVELLPKTEQYALSDQMRRAAVSIPSNIAEGYNRSSDKELLKYLYIARGSRAELETQIMIAIRLGYIHQEQAEEVMKLSREVGRMLNAYINRLTDS